jgi:serine/threonine protein kinase
VLRLDGLQRDVAEVFAEARVLEQLEHPAIIRVRDCDYAGAGRTRPFLVMDYFEGQNLSDHVARHGPLAVEDWLALAREISAGLHAAHQRGILHRDVKPANLLVRREAHGWRAKLIDFGLALKQHLMHSPPGPSGSGRRSTIASGVAGTIDYAAPEQLGRLPKVPAGPRCDIYGFAKTGCYALFQTPQPLPRHWQSLPRPLAQLLEACLEEKPERRPKDFAAVLRQLDKIAEELAPTVEAVGDSVIPMAVPAEPATVLPADDPVPVLQRVDENRASRSTTPGVSVRLIYPGEKFFFDAGIDVLFDGQPVGKGTVTKGFDFTVDTAPGNHQLEVKVILRSKYYFLQLQQPGKYEVRLHYDKIWATFANRIDVQHHA